MAIEVNPQFPLVTIWRRVRGILKPSEADGNEDSSLLHSRGGGMRGVWIND